MIGHQDLTFDLASQTLELYLPHERPSSITSATIYKSENDDADGVSLTGLAIDSVSTTTDGTSGDGTDDRTKIHLTATTGIVVGRRYLLSSVDGHKETVIVQSISSGNHVHARHPLRNSYANNSTFVGMRIYGTVPTSFVQATDNLTSPTRRSSYRVKWVYVDADSATHVAQTTCSLIRYPIKNNVSPVDVDTRFPGWLDSLPTDFRIDQGRGLIETAFDTVRLDLWQEGQADHALRDPSILAELVIHKTAELAAEVAIMRGAITMEGLEVARRGYMERLQRLIRSPSVELQHSEGGASGEGTKKQLWRR